jgi:molecular chaperone GrpE
MQNLNLKDRFAQWSRSMNQEKDTMSTEQMEQNELNENDAAPIDVEADTESASNTSMELEQAKGERDQLSAQLLQAQDRLARLQAEFDNARKRQEREKQEFRDYTTGSVVEQFLPVIDNFALALNATGSAEKLRAGVQLIVKQMEEALRGLNVQAVETIGTQFDPRVHEALGSIDTVEHPDHQVLEEIRRGYKLRDKLLRPALVRIASNTAQKSE